MIRRQCHCFILPKTPPILLSFWYTFTSSEQHTAETPYRSHKMSGVILLSQTVLSWNTTLLMSTIKGSAQPCQHSGSEASLPDEYLTKVTLYLVRHHLTILQTNTIYKLAQPYSSLWVKFRNPTDTIRTSLADRSSPSQAPSFISRNTDSYSLTYILVQAPNFNSRYVYSPSRKIHPGSCSSLQLRIYRLARPNVHPGSSSVVKLQLTLSHHLTTHDNTNCNSTFQLCAYSLCI